MRRLQNLRNQVPEAVNSPISVPQPSRRKGKGRRPVHTICAYVSWTTSSFRLKGKHGSYKVDDLAVEDLPVLWVWVFYCGA